MRPIAHADGSYRIWRLTGAAPGDTDLAPSWAKPLPMKALMMRLPLLGAWAGSLRMTCTRLRSHVAFMTLESAALMTRRASEMTSLTPRSRRTVRFRRKQVQNVSASEAPMSMPSTSRRPSTLTPTAMITATEVMRSSCRSFT